MLNQTVFNKPAAKPEPAAPAEELPELQLPRAQDIRPRQKDFGGSSTPQIPWRVLALTAIVIVLGVILWTRRSHGTNTAAASSPVKTTQPTPIPASMTATTPAAKTSTEKTSAPANQPSPAANTPPAAHTNPPNSQPTNAHPQPAASLAANAGNADKNANASNEDDRSDVTVRTFPKSNPKATEKSANLTLVIRANETSWISVTADGQPVSQETLIAPAHSSIRATREIVARIGNAAGVTFLWNGQEIPADGAEAEVKTFVFDSAGMRVIPSTPTPAQTH